MKSTQQLLLVAMGLATATAHAQWTATIIHPNGYESSGAGFADGSTIYGSAVLNGINAAGTLDQGGFTSFNPNGANTSAISASSAGHQYGMADFGVEHAAHWAGSAQTFEDWNPDEATSSFIYTARNGVAGGYATFDGNQHATLWNGGGANDLTDLHQAGWLDSAVDAVWDNVQYGDATLSVNMFHAGRWSGTAASFVDMNPTGAAGSQIIATDGTRQSGFADFGQGARAVLWSGDAASAIDINPIGSTESVAFDVSGNGAAGYATFNGFAHAGYWDSSTQQFVDLHTSLGAGYDWSQAYGVQVLGNEVRVFGMARPDAGNTYQAVVWTQAVPEPVSALVFCAGIAVCGARQRRRRK